MLIKWLIYLIIAVSIIFISQLVIGFDMLLAQDSDTIICAYEAPGHFPIRDSCTPPNEWCQAWNQASIGWEEFLGGDPNDPLNYCKWGIDYSYRKCSQINEIRIYSIIQDCVGGTIDNVIEKAVSGILGLNPMNYEPKNIGDCYQFWRISFASCWGTITVNNSLLGPTMGPFHMGPIFLPVGPIDSIITLGPFSSIGPALNDSIYTMEIGCTGGYQCCWIDLTVCRISSTKVTTTENDRSDFPYECEDSYYDADLLGYLIDPTHIISETACEPECEKVKFGFFRTSSYVLNESKSIINIIPINNNVNNNLILNIETSQQTNLSIKIFDIFGREISSSTLLCQTANTINEIDFSNYSNGIYFVNIYQGNSLIKILKEIVIN